MKRIQLVVLAAVTLPVIAGCAPRTTFVNTWAAPDAKPLEFKKILVIGMFPNEQMRRSAEDQIVGMITKTQAVASYTILSQEQVKDTDLAKQKVAELGVDGAVIMCYQGTDKREEYVSGSAYTSSYYQPFWGYYGYGAGMVYSPGYVEQYNVVRVETTIYSMPDQKMIWAGMSETEDPGSLQALVDGVAKGTVTELRKHKLIK